MKNINLIVSLYQSEDLEYYASCGVKTVVVADREFAVGSPAFFTREELDSIKISAHKLGIKIAVLVNRIFFDAEFPDLDEYLLFLKTIEIDFIYFFDMSVFNLSQKLKMTKKLIYAPKAPLVNSNDALIYLDLGMAMVELADEITLAEKILIGAKLQDKVSVIIAGRLFISYSRRKLLSSYFEYLDKDYAVLNKESLYLKETTRSEIMPIIENKFGTLIYQGEVLESYRELPLLMSSGISNFRIDGMFLKRDFVLKLVKIYAQIIKGQEYDLEVLKSDNYSYTSGFYYKATNVVKE